MGRAGSWSLIYLCSWLAVWNAHQVSFLCFISCSVTACSTYRYYYRCDFSFWRRLQLEAWIQTNWSNPIPSVSRPTLTHQPKAQCRVSVSPRSLAVVLVSWYQDFCIKPIIHALHRKNAEMRPGICILNKQIGYTEFPGGGSSLNTIPRFWNFS